MPPLPPYHYGDFNSGVLYQFLRMYAATLLPVFLKCPGLSHRTWPSTLSAVCRAVPCAMAYSAASPHVAQHRIHLVARGAGGGVQDVGRPVTCGRLAAPQRPQKVAAPHCGYVPVCARTSCETETKPRGAAGQPPAA